MNEQERQEAANVVCCVPRQYHSPSGLAWFHDRSCPTGRGQKIRAVFSGASATRRRREREEIETASKGVVVPMRPRTDKLHPACIAAAADDATPCAQCSWRMGLDNEGAAWFQGKLDEAGL